VTIHSSRGPSAAHEAVGTAHSRKLLSIHDVLQRVPICRAGFYARVAKGEAPRPVKVGGRSLWVEGELDAWVDSLTARRDAT
jgi:predicted DNA-binding transcriptional regulator AlpA